MKMGMCVLGIIILMASLAFLIWAFMLEILSDAMMISFKISDIVKEIADKVNVLSYILMFLGFTLLIIGGIIEFIRYVF